MKKDIVTDEEFLSQKCEKATAADAPIAQDLLDTMLADNEAACLAANQIGVQKQVIAYLDEEDNPYIMYNPVMRRALHPFKATQTCLSHGDKEMKVTRFDSIQVAYDDLVDGELVPKKKNLQGWTAVVVQHMIDHCNGKLV